MSHSKGFSNLTMVANMLKMERSEKRKLCKVKRKIWKKKLMLMILMINYDQNQIQYELKISFDTNP